MNAAIIRMTTRSESAKFQESVPIYSTYTHRYVDRYTCIDGASSVSAAVSSFLKNKAGTFNLIPPRRAQ